MRRLKMYFLLLSGLARFAAALPNALNLRETSQILPLSVHWDLQAEEASVICSTPSVNMTTFGAVTSYGLEQAISYLANLDGQPRMDAGPASCSQVSCAYATSVYLCNDVSHVQRRSFRLMMLTQPGQIIKDPGNLDSRGRCSESHP